MNERMTIWTNSFEVIYFVILTVVVYMINFQYSWVLFIATSATLLKSTQGFKELSVIRGSTVDDSVPKTYAGFGAVFGTGLTYKVLATLFTFVRYRLIANQFTLVRAKLFYPISSFKKVFATLSALCRHYGLILVNKTALMRTEYLGAFLAFVKGRSTDNTANKHAHRLAPTSALYGTIFGAESSKTVVGTILLPTNFTITISHYMSVTAEAIFVNNISIKDLES